MSRLCKLKSHCLAFLPAKKTIKTKKMWDFCCFSAVMESILELHNTMFRTVEHYHQELMKLYSTSIISTLEPEVIDLTGDDDVVDVSSMLEATLPPSPLRLGEPDFPLPPLAIGGVDVDSLVALAASENAGE